MSSPPNLGSEGAWSWAYRLERNFVLHGNDPAILIQAPRISIYAAGKNAPIDSSRREITYTRVGMHRLPPRRNPYASAPHGRLTVDQGFPAMAMICPKCIGVFEQQLICPACS